ncbi:glycosyltransferase [Brevundimonas sp.]|jgi:glycosyltransferase involved in cell wall biosynthesis|uniref:glycosyltransferase n=1 Tax=Brevundimonas sp. TaxID=1871086 RepID=UPI0039197E68
MKLLHLLHTPRHSGAEILVRDLCLEHVRNGVTCAIAAFGEGTPEFSAELAKLRSAGVTIFTPSASGSRWTRLSTYVRAMQSFRPDAIFGHSLLPAAYGRLARQLVAPKARFIKVLHSSSDDYQSPRVRLVERLLQGSTDAVITVAPGAADYYRLHFRRTPRIVLVANGINSEPIQAAVAQRSRIRGALGLSEGDRLLLQVGRIAPIKNQRLSLEATLPLLKANPRMRLWFAGLVEDAAYHAALLADIEASGLMDRILDLGARSDIPDLLAAADVYLMPSALEAQGIAFLEALASGIPVVASSIPAFDFAAGMAHLWSTPLDDTTAFTDLVARALAAPGRVDRDLSAFTVAATARTYEDLARAG